jgi:predicted phage terminase large subunit-like protein
MNDALNDLRTDKYLLASSKIYLYANLFVEEVEPRYIYNDKFFTMLSLDYDYFINQSNVSTFLLEASPRTGKTEFLINVVLSYLIGSVADKRFLLVAGNNILRRKLRRLISRVCKSDFFQKIFPDVKITLANELDMSFSNGNLINFITTNSQTPTGEGYHYMFLIDFLNYSIIRSEAMMENALDQLVGLLSRTQHDPFTKFFIDNQRLSTNDLSFYISSNYKNAENKYYRITAPYYFENDRKYQLLKEGGGSISFKAGEYLVSRFNDKTKKEVIAQMGERVFLTQYQQEPVDHIGSYVELKDLIREDYEITIQRQFTKIVVSVDMAIKSDVDNDFSAVLVFGVNQGKYYVLDCSNIKQDLEELKILIASKYIQWKAKDLLIEDKVTGSSMIDYFRKYHALNNTNQVINVEPYKPVRSKEERMEGCEGVFKAGNFVIPKDGQCQWTLSYINQLINFPNVKNDDMVDATTQFLLWHMTKSKPIARAPIVIGPDSWD